MRRRIFKGWSLYALTVILAYPLLFGLLWTRQVIRASWLNSTSLYSRMDVSLKEIAIFAGIGVACLTILVACADWGRQSNKGLQAASDSRHPHRRSRMAGWRRK
jgi:hypothetical protein